MKKILSLMIAAFVLLSATAAYGIVSLPPSNPSIEPPGKFLSEEQRELSRLIKACKEQYDETVKHCRKAPGITDPTTDPECIRKAQQALQACYEAARFLANPPKLKLPNGDSPGN